MGKHYSEEEIKKAVDLYIQYGQRASAVKAALGYPERHVLRNWYNYYIKTGNYKKPHARSNEYAYSNIWTNKEVEAAVAHYIQTGKSLKHTINSMGYPNRPGTLREWIKKVAPEERKVVINTGTQNRYSETAKIAAISEYANNSSGKTVQQFADEHNVSRLSIYTQIYALEKQGYNIPRMEKKNTEKMTVSMDELTVDYAKLVEENKRLEKLNNKLNMENDILIKASELLKKAEHQH